jgi:uncharacterized membrane protein
MKKITVKELAFISILAALVYVTSAYLQIPIPTAIGSTRLHMGNVMCLLSGLLLGPLQGGLAAGIGSMFFDLTNPLYIASAPFTFAFKFIMAWLCGIIAHKCGKEVLWKTVLGAVIGAVTYVILYLGKSFIEDHFVLGLPLEAVILTVAQKGLVSTVNGIIAAVVSVPLYMTLRPLLKRANLISK